ncbi:disease resistance protein RUN1-like [Euphorbia lathyris]|uniref:disease resistance protein RUN1-like n=1 Tax=Euphorbia lathyris TaxID=212925 RepID=UPI0033139491
MENCKDLKILPDSICELKCLQTLNLSDCSKLAKLPPLNGLKSLKKLHLISCGIIELPTQLSLSLVDLTLDHCSDFKILRDNICELKCLETLALRYCSNLEQIPPLNGLNSLKLLEIISTSIIGIPSELPSSLVHLSIMCCRNLKNFPTNIFELKSLQTLRLNGCLILEKLPSLNALTCLTSLGFSSSTIVEIPSELPSSLVHLSITDCRNLKILPANIFELKSLQTLCLSGCTILKKLPPLNALTCLATLDLSSTAIVEIPAELPSSLKNLRLENCQYLRVLPRSIFGLKFLEIHLPDCSNLFKSLPLNVLRRLMFLSPSSRIEIQKEITIRNRLSYRVAAAIRKRIKRLQKH